MGVKIIPLAAYMLDEMAAKSNNLWNQKSKSVRWPLSKARKTNYRNENQIGPTMVSSELAFVNSGILLRTARPTSKGVMIRCSGDL